MLLALYKAAGFWSRSEGFSGFKLVHVLIQDQVIYFIWLEQCLRNHLFTTLTCSAFPLIALHSAAF